METKDTKKTLYIEVETAIERFAQSGIWNGKYEFVLAWSRLMKPSLFRAQRH